MDSQMNIKEKVEEQIRKTLDVFEQKQSLPPNPYFYTRVQQQIKERSENKSRTLGFLKPALLTLLLLINLGTFIYYLSSAENYSATEKQQEIIQLLSSDLNLNTNQNNIFLAE
jgi:hypothetical protein